MRHHFYKCIALTSLLMGMAGSAWSASQAFEIGVSQTGRDVDSDGIFDSFSSGSSATVGFDGLTLPPPSQGFATEYRYAFEFDLASLPSGAVIDSASLSLRARTPNFAGRTLLSGYAGDGAIDLQDMTGGSALLSFTPRPFLDTVDVSTFVQGVYGSGQSWVGFNLRQSPLGRQRSAWDSFQLNVEYSVSAVPEPQAYLMLLLGLGVVAGVARRRRNA